MKIHIIFFVSLILLSNSAYGQWNQKWKSTEISSVNSSGWFKFDVKAPEGGQRFYIVDVAAFSIMESELSQTPQYTYSFTPEEISSGNLVYSLGYDLTGDGLSEFYVLATTGTSEIYRQSFKIFDITNSNILFERNDPTKYFSYPVVWDVDNDGLLDCSFATYDYPYFTTYVYEVYGTGVSAGPTSSLPVNLNFELKQNYPNPFNPETTIEYTVEKPGFLSIDIYNIKGEIVNTIYSGYKNNGTYKNIWNGENRYGEKVSSGTYFYQITNEDHKETKKMILLK